MASLALTLDSVINQNFIGILRQRESLLLAYVFAGTASESKKMIVDPQRDPIHQ